MANLNPDDLLNFLKSKKERHSIRVTTRIKGELKNQFLSDCITRQSNESKMAHTALGVYYVIIEQYPEVARMEMTDIKKYINGKMRL